jgi:hypothetical protein
LNTLIADLLKIVVRRLLRLSTVQDALASAVVYIVRPDVAKGLVVAFSGPTRRWGRWAYRPATQATATAVSARPCPFAVRPENSVRGLQGDLLAERPGERVAIEVETGKSDITGNLGKVLAADFGRVVLVAISPVAVIACQEAVECVPEVSRTHIVLMTWLDVS